MADELRIGYFADGPWSHKALEELLSLDFCKVLFIVPRFDTQDPILRKYASQLKIPFLPIEDVNSYGALKILEEFNANLFVSMSFNQIIKRQLLDLPSYGFINCHAGALPFYRGRNPLNWALINGEETFGVTVHYIDEGIDTGDIITQIISNISDDDDYRTLLEKAITNCALAIRRAVVEIAFGTVKRLKQSDICEYGFYCGVRRQGDESVDWSLSSQRIHNFIRALTLPGPGARTSVGDEHWAVLRSRLLAGAPQYICTAGEVVGKDEHGVFVKTGDSILHLSNVAPVNDDGFLGESVVPKFRIGTRLR